MKQRTSDAAPQTVRLDEQLCEIGFVAHKLHLRDPKQPSILFGDGDRRDVQIARIKRQFAAARR
jgi:hypothetical protein